MIQALDVASTVARAQAGSSAAIGDLYDAYAEALRRFCYLRLRDQHAAEDCVQETFVCVWKAIRSFTYRNDGAFVSWLFTIAQRQLLTYVRGQRRGIPTSSLEGDGEPPQPDATHAICGRLALDAAIDSLTAKQRQVIILKFFVGLSNQETAALVRSTEGGVKLLQIRALANLRRSLHEPPNARCMQA